ncbi:MAG: Gamma-glutamylputrescine oxidoreductase [Paracidovorax wautersii]|uniref:Gamma-glutamylputrescine oxidoreductase n=1 Tax=Paracidovorax wautersii TaxID=1177982 RepID=A0A7V8FQI8_9BURK|nr:MAG: Gamma-glutamylputrescine oxidoreductase [Paracidovorax wautersii]
MKGDVHSHGLWEASAPPAPATPALEGEAPAVDAAVVGAGYTGLSAALHLREGGARVAVLEAQDVGFGGSGRNVGLVNAGLWITPQTVLQTAGPVHGPRLLQCLGEAPSLVYTLIDQHGIDCQAQRHGTLHCAVGRQGLRNIETRWRQWKDLGAPVELLDARAIALATGCAAYAGGLRDLRAGTVQPLAYARGLAHAAVGAGAHLYTNSRVTGVQDRQTHWRLQTAQGRIDAKWIIVATDAYTDGPWSALQREQIRLPYFNMATAPLSERLRARILPNGEGAWDTRQVLSSFRLDQAGRLVFGSVGALRGGASHRIHADWGRRALARLFPELGHVTFEYAWYGQIGMTTNALPRFHTLARNTVAIAGYNGRGIAPGTALGRELARLVLGQIDASDLPLPTTTPDHPPFKPAREAFYEYGALAAHAGGGWV